MRGWWIVAAVAALVGTPALADAPTPGTCPPAPGSTPDKAKAAPGAGRVVGGCRAPGGTAPWAVEIYKSTAFSSAVLKQDDIDRVTRDGQSDFIAERPSWDSHHICGGVLIARNWVLTAGHCLQDVPLNNPSDAQMIAYLKANRAIRIGSQDIGPDAQGHPSGSQCALKDVIIYPGDDDLGLIRIDQDTCQPQPGAGTVRPIRIGNTQPDDKLSFTNQTPLTVLGWGMTRAKRDKVTTVLTTDTRALQTARYIDQQSRYLKLATLAYVPPAVCRHSPGYAGQITPRMICAGHAAGGVDACDGDSGGPLVINRVTGPAMIVETLLVGIVHASNGCAQKRTPGMYVYVPAPAFIDWIAATIAPGGDIKAGRALLAAQGG